jgi:hypothetical protein
MTLNSAKAKYADLVDRYKELRKITRKLHNFILPEYLSREAYLICAARLGMLQNNTVVFADMDESSVLMDYCIYDYREEGVNAVSRYVADFQADADSDEYPVVKAMLQSFHTLVQVEDVLPGVGVRVNDLLGNKQFLIIDMGFSKTAIKGVVIAARILPFEDFVMTSGAPLPVDAVTLLAILDYASQHYGSEDGKHIYANVPEKADLTAAIIRMCLAANSSDQIEYEDVEVQPTILPLRRDRPVGRNHPCPCGSGRKYKRCCGR